VVGTVVTDTNNVLAGLQTVSKTDSTQFTQNYNYFLDSNVVSGTFSSVLGPLLGTHGANATLLGSLYTYIVNNILSNMTSITTAATSVSPHLNSGDMGAQITIADAALAVIQNNLDSMNSQFENVLSLLASIDSFNIRYAIIFYGVILGMALLILIIIIFMKCFRMTSCRHAIYLICFIMFFFCLLLFICTIILSILMPTLYYTCQYFQNTFTSPTAFTNMIVTLQGASYTNLANQFAQCFGGTNGFMTAVNPSLQGYISQLKTAVFNSKLYEFTTMNTTVNSQLTTIKTAIDDTGLGRIPDFDTSTTNGITQIDNFDAIANKSTFSVSCP
jgi:tetrahydromethanopterin S-methyltransferase subunit G